MKAHSLPYLDRGHTHTQYRPSRPSPVPVTGEKTILEKKRGRSKSLEEERKTGTWKKTVLPVASSPGPFLLRSSTLPMAMAASAAEGKETPILEALCRI